MGANLLHEQLANIQKKCQNTKYHAILSSAANSQLVSESLRFAIHASDYRHY